MDDLPNNKRQNPCLGCGACCAHYRCSFYWREADDATPGGVPVELTEDVTRFRRAMRGTNQNEPRCIALVGTIGKTAHCTIYERRSTTCRKFVPSYYEGQSEIECDKARLRHGLPALQPQDWAPEQDDKERPTRPRRPRKLRRAA